MVEPSITVKPPPMDEVAPTLGVTVRGAHASEYVQTFLVVGVVTLLLTRLFLQLTGFPKIGGDSELHIAHVLIGGGLMTATLVLLFTFLGNAVKSFASVLGGIGFGLFIDELGKFITSNNNYFFQPTVALIYIVFIALFLWFRAIERRSLSSVELVANAGNILENSLVNGAHREDVARALEYLERSGVHGDLPEAIRLALSSSGTRRSASPVAWIAEHAWRLYDWLTELPAFRTLAPAVFVLHGVIGVVFALAAGYTSIIGTAVTSMPEVDRQVAVAGDVAALVALGLAVTGATVFRHSRLEAYRWFERGVLVALFFCQLSLFWLAELAATSMLVLDLILLGAVRFLIRQQAGRNAIAAVRDVRSLAVLSALDRGARHPGATETDSPRIGTFVESSRREPK
jgi:hypothetical protein